jgi:hypothetical protein
MLTLSKVPAIVGVSLSKVPIIVGVSLSKVPIIVGVSRHLRTERDPASETLFLFRISGDERSPETL